MKLAGGIWLHNSSSLFPHFPSFSPRLPFLPLPPHPKPSAIRTLQLGSIFLADYPDWIPIFFCSNHVFPRSNRPLPNLQVNHTAASLPLYLGLINPVLTSYLSVLPKSTKDAIGWVPSSLTPCTPLWFVPSSLYFSSPALASLLFPATLHSIFISPSFFFFSPSFFSPPFPSLYHNPLPSFPPSLFFPFSPALLPFHPLLLGSNPCCMCTSVVPTISLYIDPLFIPFLYYSSWFHIYCLPCPPGVGHPLKVSQ